MKGMKFNFVIIGLCILVFSIVGCSVKSSDNKSFDDDELDIGIEKTQKMPDGFTYQLKFKNNSSFTLKNNILFLSYPIKDESGGSKENPFKIEGRSLKGNIKFIKPGDEVKITIYAPINEVFTDTKLIDIEHPSIEVKGYVLQGNEEVPYMKGIGS